MMNYSLTSGHFLMLKILIIFYFFEFKMNEFTKKSKIAPEKVTKIFAI